MSDQNPKKHVIQPVGNLIQLLTPKTEKVEKCEMASDTNYYHYNCLSEDDYGWGCSYRCCQMIVSHYVIRSIIGITLEEVPSLKDIQCGLFEVGKNIVIFMQINNLQFHMNINPLFKAYFLKKILAVINGLNLLMLMLS